MQSRLYVRTCVYKSYGFDVNSLFIAVSMRVGKGRQRLQLSRWNTKVTRRVKISITRNVMTFTCPVSRGREKRFLFNRHGESAKSFRKTRLTLFYVNFVEIAIKYIILYCVHSWASFESEQQLCNWMYLYCEEFFFFFV